MNPGITGGSERMIRCFVGISEKGGVRHDYGTVVTCLCGCAIELSFFAVELADVTEGLIRPLAFLFGHEPNLIRVVSVIESHDFHGVVFMEKPCGQLHVTERVALNFGRQAQFEDAPFLNIFCGGLPCACDE